jgi:hypothetical protein
MSSSEPENGIAPFLIDKQDVLIVFICADECSKHNVPVSDVLATIHDRDSFDAALRKLYDEAMRRKGRASKIERLTSSLWQDDSDGKAAK